MRRAPHILAPCAALAVALMAGCGLDLSRILPHRQETSAATKPSSSGKVRKKRAARQAPASSGASAAGLASAAPDPSAAAAASAAASAAEVAAEVAAECQALQAASDLRSSQGPGEGSRPSEQKFPFDDDEYLLPNQSNGGLVYVPAAVPPGASVPLVIFLHGTNAGGPLHRGLGSGAGPLTSSAEIEAGYDLRPVVQEMIDQGKIAPLIIGGPSQTREAGHGHDLWPAFDPIAFADAAEKSLGDRARIDRRRVVVVGHSGAGCSPTGGGLVGLAQRLGKASEQLPPRALVAIDTCLDDWVCDAFTDASQSTAVWVYFQTATWERPFEAFRTKFLPPEDDDDDPAEEPERRRLVSIEGLSGDAAHNLSLPRGLRLALPGLLPPRVCP